jgi:hypothetical protein
VGDHSPYADLQSPKFRHKGKTINTESTENAEDHKEYLQVFRAYLVTANVAIFDCSHLLPATCNLPSAPITLLEQFDR